ncbi:hypothetical protein ACFO26_02190 [Lactococcus nasutitermitis]|uniref:Uncharacterized protein n=1 Tax=Lactococcus nasutitermitis TaxID=1652957 RepID=A0ABV9JCJ1_9LACT|nr:hypothetical protein [Lactococcus nasutitermitis]
MSEHRLPWENPQQNYNITLAKRRSERRYRTLQLAKTLRVLLTDFKSLKVEKFNAEIVNQIEQLEKNADFIDEEEFSAAKKYVSKMKRELGKWKQA